MPPWLDWLDWLKWDCIGAGIIGKVLGHWFRFCVSVIRTLLVTLLSPLQRLAAHSSDYRAINGSTQEVRGGSPYVRKLIKLAVSTFLTFVVWGTVTWKPIWSAAGPTGDRILAAVLFLVSALWVVSLLWICFSKPRRSKVAILANSPADAGSRTARAS